jgi:hypothetical protein
MTQPDDTRAAVDPEREHASGSRAGGRPERMRLLES